MSDREDQESYRASHSGSFRSRSASREPSAPLSEKGSVHSGPSGSLREKSATPHRSPTPRSRSRSGSRASYRRSRSRSPPPAYSRSRSRSRSRRRYYSRSRSRSRSPYRSSRRRSRYSRSRSRSRSPYRSSRGYGGGGGGGGGGYDRYNDRYRGRRYRRGRSRSPMSRRRRHVGSREDPKESKCLGIFGLSLYTQERDLREHFGKYGPVGDIQIVTDHQTGRSRGFAFLYFKNVEDAVEAKERAPGTEIDGRKIRVDYSITERAHTPTPGIYLGKPTIRHRSPSYRRYSRSRSRSYSPRRY